MKSGWQHYNSPGNEGLQVAIISDRPNFTCVVRSCHATLSVITQLHCFVQVIYTSYCNFQRHFIYILLQWFSLRQWRWGSNVICFVVDVWRSVGGDAVEIKGEMTSRYVTVTSLWLLLLQVQHVSCQLDSGRLPTMPSINNAVSKPIAGATAAAFGGNYRTLKDYRFRLCSNTMAKKNETEMSR